MQASKIKMNVIFHEILFLRFLRIPFKTNESCAPVSFRQMPTSKKSKQNGLKSQGNKSTAN